MKKNVPYLLFLLLSLIVVVACSSPQATTSDPAAIPVVEPEQVSAPPATSSDSSSSHEEAVAADSAVVLPVHEEAVAADSPVVLPVSDSKAPVSAFIDTTDVQAVANHIVDALARQDMLTVAALVHPNKGVRFSPYTYVTESHLIFMPKQLTTLLDDQQLYIWGIEDGSGAPIEATFAAYYERFIYDHDYINPEIVGVNETFGTTNSINNQDAFYPKATSVEYHFSGFDPAYTGLDWASLRLLFEPNENGEWQLVGIIHNGWTI